VQGDAPGPLVVIEQGVGSPAPLWWPIQARVAQFARVCTYDRAGYLWSERVPGPRTLADRVADLEALLTRAELPPPYVLVGYSLGGLLMLRFALSHPERVAGMVLVDSGHERSLRDVVWQNHLASGARFSQAGEWLTRFGVMRLFPALNPMLPEQPAARAFMLAPGFSRAMREDFLCLMQEGRVPAAPPRSEPLGSRPLSVITHGIAFPGPAAAIEATWSENQTRLAALSSNSELIVARRSNHLIHVDEPEVVVEAIRRVYTAARDGLSLGRSVHGQGWTDGPRSLE
jgi:pimeloyl-ACP methyl ester carboxylesterase